MIDRLVDAARQMAGPNPIDSYKLAAIRRAIYVAGPWNYNRAFSYDLSDPFGKVPANRLLSTYIRTRKGNCVSMPILFMIVADRMGLNVHLATADRSTIDRAMFDPSSADAALAKLTMTDLMKRRAEVEAKITAAEAAWLEASEKLETIAA